MRTVRDGGETRRIAAGSLSIAGNDGKPLVFFRAAGGTRTVTGRLVRSISGGSISGLKEPIMGRGILLWMLGVPIPIIILLALFFR